MQTISPEYKELISRYHADKEAWGSGSHRHAGLVADLAEEGDTILDYGCGKGNLKRNLPGFVVNEYDPGIPGKDAKPEPADVVVCTDVLEHIEPEFIDKVIGEIYSLTRKVAYITIAMRPARAVLPDGRNAHLIVEDWDWWREKLAKYFVFDQVIVLGMEDGKMNGEAQVVVRPIRELKQIPGKGAIPDEIRNEQMAACLKRGLPRLQLSGESNGKVAILACYGPSLKYTLPKLKMLTAEKDADVFTVSGAHDFLISNGIVPYAHCDIDGREHKAQLMNNPHRDVKYWMASVCHPTYFDKLEGYDVSIFHILNTQETEKWVNENDPGSWLLAGGVTVGNRMLGLLYHMGYREVHVFGMDCSKDHEGNRHAGHHTGKPQRDMRVLCGNVWFDTTAQMVNAARDMLELISELKGIDYDVTFYGDGLLQKMISEATGISGHDIAA